MILPGISGSFILLMIGMYEAVLAAVDDADLAVLAVFAAGAVVGLAGFATLLDRLLRDHHDTVLAALIGLMAGSLRVLWPWPPGDGAGLGAPEDWWLPLLLAVAAAAAVLAVGRAGSRRSRTAGA
jgi:putative membrane protein